jgi:serine/threonine protein kinase/Tfp pilus assembly protein PilF
MNGTAAGTSGRIWDEASSPEAIQVARRYEESWRRSGRVRPDLGDYLAGLDGIGGGSGLCLALFRTDMTLRWEANEKVEAQWYRDRFLDLSDETLVALVYEEFCLREEVGDRPDPVEFRARYPSVSKALERVFEIHGLVGSGAVSVPSMSTGGDDSSDEIPFPVVGQTIAGFHLVEELGRGAFARVFLAHERQLADRPVALKVTRRGSREPQTLARLQHTHIVPVYSHRVDPATGLNLLCMPYFGRITLARILSDSKTATSHYRGSLAEALDRLAPTECSDPLRSEGRVALGSRTVARAVAWWGARLAEALQHAHERGVLHRDIKPSNVLVTADGMPMLLDFNLAREPLVEGQEESAAGNLGGTVDYMAPEHLEGLADCLPHQVDGRSDLFGLGVVLYEAVMGHRPFPQVGKRSTMSETLLNAADERRAGPPRLRDSRPEVPPALETVIRRCLEPAPADRYQTGAELAADLQAVSDSRPLVIAREPILNRIATWARHRRRRLITAASIMLALTVALAAATAVSLEQWLDDEDQYRGAEALFEGGNEAYKKGNFDKAASLYNAADRRAKSGDWRQSIGPEQLRTPGGLRALVRSILLRSDRKAKLEDLQEQAHSMATHAWARDQRCDQADDIHRAADGLRFRLIRLGDDLASASTALQKALEPFRILPPAPIEDWTKRPDVKDRLDSERIERLRHEVNELMFLWVCAIDETLSKSTSPDPRTIHTALNLCDHALAFAEPPGPWRALRARLERQQAAGVHLTNPPAGGTDGTIPGTLTPSDDFTSADVREEKSSLAAFQWGLLSMIDRKVDAALPWFERAVRLEAKNYWYQYSLALAYDMAGGRARDAMVHYDLAVDLSPNSPWIRFDRARLLHRSSGRWKQAVDDLESALDEFRGQREARQIENELGVVHQSLGDDRKARDYFNRVVRKNSTDSLGRAARLNLANSRAELGLVADALVEYEKLLAVKPMDQPARRSRAILLLQSGDAKAAAEAEADLTFLVDLGAQCEGRDQVLASRALARLMQGPAKAEAALADATAAWGLVASQEYKRLRQRAILASGRIDELRLDRPRELARLPLGGRGLEADLRAAIAGLDQWIGQRNVHVYPAALTQAVILAVLNDPRGADTKATLALQASPDSPHALLIRARNRHYAGNLQGAMADVNLGLEMSPNEPELQEVKAAVLTAMGRPAEALTELRLINTEWVQHPSIDTLRAQAYMAMGRHSSAITSWNLAIRKDPQLAEAYLGRAHCRLMQGQWSEAVVDLSHAMAWAHDDVGLEVQAFWGFTRCLAYQPSLARRWISMGRRLVSHAWDQWGQGPNTRLEITPGKSPVSK